MKQAYISTHLADARSAGARFHLNRGRSASAGGGPARVQYLFHLTQGGTGNYKGEGLRPLGSFHSLPAQRQTVAVHRHQGQAGLVHFKEGTGVDGAALIVTDGEQGLGDHPRPDLAAA